MLLHELTTYQNEQLTLVKIRELAKAKGVSVQFTATVKKHFSTYRPLLEWALKQLEKLEYKSEGVIHLGILNYIKELNSSLMTLYLIRANYLPIMEELKALQQHVREERISHLIPTVVSSSMHPPKLQKELEKFLSIH